MQIVQIEFYREEIFCFQKFALPQKREDKEVNFFASTNCSSSNSSSDQSEKLIFFIVNFFSLSVSQLKPIHLRQNKQLLLATTAVEVDDNTPVQNFFILILLFTKNIFLSYSVRSRRNGQFRNEQQKEAPTFNSLIFYSKFRM